MVLLKEQVFTEIENPFFNPDVHFLSNFVAESVSEDPSMHSLSYVLMTSRKGLSAFRGQHSTVLFSKHPNLDDTYIMYPPDNDNGYSDVADLSNILKARGAAVQVIRVPESKVKHCLSFVKGNAATETVLDYTHPVHIVDVNSLILMKGTGFLKFRNKMNAIRRLPIEARLCEFSAADVVAMRDIVKRWSLSVFGGEADTSAAYIYYALDALIRLPNIKCLIAYLNDVPVGFTLWENPSAGYDVANSLIHCCLHERGLSEFMHYEMAKSLREMGVDYLSLGGAESAGLDAFKRKMQPVRSIRLLTVHS